MNEKSSMSEKAFLIVKTDNSAWVLTYHSETQKRMVYEFHSWLLDRDPAPSIESAGPWLEHESAAIEAAYPIDTENRIIRIDENARLEYTELLEDVALY